MPKLDHRVSVQTFFSYQEHMIVTMLVEQLNILRQEVGLAPLTMQDLRREVRDYLRAHPRQEAP
jgi:hypothetical protein